MSLLAEVNSIPFDRAYVDSATGSFEAWYAGSPETVRAHVDQVLDELESGETQLFSSLSVLAQRERLHAWRHASALATDAHRTPLSSRRRALARSAISLASPPYGDAFELKVAPLFI